MCLRSKGGRMWVYGFVLKVGRMVRRSIWFILMRGCDKWSCSSEVELISRGYRADAPHVGQSALWITIQCRFRGFESCSASFKQWWVSILQLESWFAAFSRPWTSAVYNDCSLRAWCWHYQFRKLASPNPRLTIHTSNLKTTFMTNKESQLVLGEDIQKYRIFDQRIDT